MEKTGGSKTSQRIAVVGVCFVVVILILACDFGGGPRKQNKPVKKNPAVKTEVKLDQTDQRLLVLVRAEEENKRQSIYQVPQFLGSGSVEVEKIVLDSDSGAGWLKLKVPSIAEDDGNKAIINSLCSCRVAPVIDGRTPLINDDFQKFADCWCHHESNDQTHVFRIFVEADIAKVTTLEICPEDDSLRRRLKITPQNRLYLVPYHQTNTVP